MRILLVCMLLMGFWGEIYAQNPKFFIKNYSPKEYEGETQNWCIAQDQRGIMYFANNQGVLEYDGVTWQCIRTANESIARSLALGKDGKIYVGAEHELGYIFPDKQGKNQYHSLVPLIPEEYRDFGIVWSVVSKGQEIFFQTYDYIFAFKENKFRVWKVKDSYHRLFMVDDKLYLRQKNIGLTVLEQDEFVLAPQGEFFKDKTISAFLPYQKNQYLIGTRNDGLFLYEPTKKLVSPFVTQIDQELADAGIYHGILYDETFVLGTTRKGIFMLDKKGKLFKKIDRTNGLQNQGALFLFEDKAKNLWAALNSGIARTEVSSPIMFWDKSSNIDGITDITEFNNKIYTVSNSGIHQISDNYAKLFSTQTRAWSLLNFQPQDAPAMLLVGLSREEGISIFENDKLKNIYAYPNNVSVYKLVASKKYPNRVWVGENLGIASLNYQNGKWTYQKVKDLGTDVRTICETPEGNLWLGTSSNGIYNIQFLTPQADTAVVFRYDTAHGLPTLKNNFSFEVKNQIIFGTQSGFYAFDKSTQSFVPKNILGKANAKKNIYSLHEDQNGNLWVGGLNSKTSPMGVAYNQKNGYFWEDRIFRKIPQMLETIITTASDGSVWIGGSEGLFRYKTDFPKDYLYEYPVLIRQISLEDSVVFYGNILSGMQVVTQNDRVLQLQHHQNSLTFHYASPSYEDEEAIFYRHILEGYDEHWSAWSRESKKEYTNLPHGKFVFKVQARNLFGKESEENSFYLEINPPWYRHKLAYFFYSVGIFFGFWGLIRLNTQRLEKEKNNLEFLVQARTSEITKQNQVLEKQKQEITTQRDDISRQKYEIEKAYADIETISEIGQKITATLDFDKMIDTLYKSVNSLIDAAVFGVGVFDEAQQFIVFRGFIENGEKHPTISESIHDRKKFSAWCFRMLKPIVMNDFEQEYKNYIQADYKMIEGLPQSLIYLPLLIENAPIGVITVQSFQKNAYERFDITILQTLASYVAVALKNSKSYEIIAENNRKITDSIRYAKSIQQAILPHPQELAAVFEEHFVIFQPKDIVSGDFYWFSEISATQSFLALVDCTGHGVPGAFMSMVGSDLLNEIVNIKHILEPAQVLEHLNLRIREALRQESRANDDGMDVSLCLFEKQEKEIHLAFGAAKQSIYCFYKDKKELYEYKGDNKSIGGWQKNSRKFTNQHLYLQKGDTVYLHSDGILDQPNQDREKFGSQNYKRLLKDVQHLPLEEQKEMILKVLQLYTQKEAQRDDITVIALKF